VFKQLVSVLGPTAGAAPGGSRTAPCAAWWCCACWRVGRTHPPACRVVVGAPDPGSGGAGGERAPVLAPPPGTGVMSLSPEAQARCGRVAPRPVLWAGRGVLACVGACGWGRPSRSGTPSVPCPCRTRPAPVGVTLPGGGAGPGGAERAVPWAWRRVSRPCPKRTEHGESLRQGGARLGGGGRWLGGTGPRIGPQHPNQGVQATLNSLRSCLAPAIERA